MLNKEKFRLFAGNNIFTITILTIELMTITHAQGITNTLGGNTATEKFIVENSDSEAGLVVTGEGNVGIGTTNPSIPLQVMGRSAGQVGIQFNGENPYWSSIYVNALEAGSNPGFGYLRSGYLRAHTYCNSSDSWVVSTGYPSADRLVVDAVGNVGIGTTSPNQMLEINGKIKIGTDGSTPTAGTIRFLNGHFEGYDGSTWKQLDN